MADPSYMNIRFETLQQAHDDLSRAHAAVQATIGQLEAELQKGLVHWSGPARDAYGPIKRQWDDAVADMANVLASAFKHLATAADLYQSAEHQNVSIWNA